MRDDNELDKAIEIVEKVLKGSKEEAESYNRIVKLKEKRKQAREDE